MSKKAKVFLIKSIIRVPVIVAAIITLFICPPVVTHTDLGHYLNISVKIDSDYSKYEDENEEPDEVIVHENPDSPEQDLSDIVLPEDFSFKLAWGQAKGSYYNSKTGKMIREIHEKEIEKYTKYVLLSEYELVRMYKLLFINTDITTYPDKLYLNKSDESGITCVTEPHSSLKITVYAYGEEKTVEIENFTDVSDRSDDLVKSLDSLIEFITSTKEWQAFPETTVGYM